MAKKEAKSSIFSFQEARRVARGHGFDSKEEYIEYSCPGAYQLPKNPEEVWQDDWKGWDDFLGITYDNFQQARDIARSLSLKSEEEYLKIFKEKKLDDNDPAIRLPYRPDLRYKFEWQNWDDWLGL